MKVGQELNINEVRALLDGTHFRRYGIEGSTRDCLNDAEKNFKDRVSVDELIPESFTGYLHYNKTTKPYSADVEKRFEELFKVNTAVILRKTNNPIVYSDRIISDGNGIFYYAGQTIGF